MPRRIPTLASCSLCAAVLVACAPDGLGVGSARQLITRGADAEDPAVAALLDGEHAFCTGTLISPRILLTAAHCIGGDPAPIVFFGTDAAAGGETRELAASVRHAAFSWRGLHNDVGLLVLGEPAPAGISPVPLWTGVYPSPSSDPTVRVVGFGLTRAGEEPGARKREGISRVVDHDGTSFSLVADPSQACLGDSGGPVFAEEGGVEVLVGVTSSGDPECDAYSTAMRVDAYLDDFILPHLDEEAEPFTLLEGRSPEGPSACAVPPGPVAGPAPAWLLAVGAVLFRLRARRSG